jgi:pimeloyl-ACP methyl ester carboxylesterase
VQLAGFAAAEVEFDRAGELVGDRGAAVRALAADPAVTDLVVLCHGWNNDHLVARLLYSALAGSMRAVSAGLPGRRIAFACVLWPSRKLAGLEPDAGLPERLDQLRDLVPGQRLTIDAAADLVPALPARATARTAFAGALLSVATRGADDSEDASTQLFTLPGGTVMDRLGTTGFTDAAAHLLDFLAYYEMKARAGDVGVRGLAPLLATCAGPKLHLVGHSFGGRLVTAAANARPAGSVATLTLLQAAFSHHGFAADPPGAFRGVLDERVVTGPILVTHSANDLAVGVAYAIASRIAGQTASAVGDASSPYGGIGHNGAQRTPEAVTAELLPVSGTYRWQPSVPHNLLADRFIRGHTDVCGPQIAHALWSAIAAS